MKKIWRIRPPSSSAALLARETGLSLLEAQLLIHRGISDASTVHAFLSPRLSQLLDPMLLKDMDRAVASILRAVEDQRPITIYGDFDVDGLTATALLLRFFASLDIPASAYIPDRLQEGYGLNLAAVKRIAHRGPGLLVTVDCGIANGEEITLAKSLGMEVVVTDHHRLPGDFEPVCPVVNPQRPDSQFPFRHLSGVGLAFFLTIALRAAMRQRAWFRHRPEPDLKAYLILVALGTTADMVPLVDQNRILVASGLQRMDPALWPGIEALQEVAGTRAAAPIRSEELAFTWAPRLNAPGRLGAADVALRVLTSRERSIARVAAAELNRMNQRRQAIERQVLADVERELESEGDLAHQRTLVFAGPDWHRGVLGIVASRLVNRLYRPTLVMSVNGHLAYGSGRSIAGFNLYHALSQSAHLFRKFGGHDHAAGFTLEANRIADLQRELEAYARRELTEELLTPEVIVDAEVTLAELTRERIAAIRSLSPFGPGNPEPVFYASAVEVLRSQVVSQRHLRLRLRQGNAVVEAIGFGLSEEAPEKGDRIDAVFTPDINRWLGNEKIQLRLVDVKVGGKKSRLVREM
jgi:single-stranded-DNA-specific exonuclease